MINKIIRTIERNKNKLIIILLIIIAIYYFFLRDPEIKTLTKPVFSIKETEIYAETEVYIKSEENADIHYEIKNIKTEEEPELNLLSRKFDERYPIKLEYNNEIEIIAFAYKRGYNDSPVARKKYIVKRKEEAPEINFYENNTITIISNFGASIYYTIDGTDPDPEKGAIEYNGRFEIKEDCIIKAIAIRQNYFPSEITKKEVKIQTEEEKTENNQYLDYNIKISGKGSVRKSVIGNSLDIEAIPDQGWEFYKWSGDIEGQNKYQRINLIDDKKKEINIVAEFNEIINTYNYRIKEIGNGKVKETMNGTILNIEAIPDQGWEFYKWSGDVSASEYETNIDLKTNERYPGTKNITAEFKEIETLTEKAIDNYDTVKIIKDKETIMLTQKNGVIKIYEIDYDRKIRWKIKNNIIREKEIKISGEAIDIISGNNEYIVLCNLDKNRPYLIKIKKSNLEHEILDINQENIEAKKIIKTGPQKYIIAGNYTEKERKIILITIEGEKVIWKKIINESSKETYEKIADLVIEKEDIYIIGSIVQKYNNDIILTKIDINNPDNEEINIFGSSNDDIAGNIVSINDKEKVITAESNNIYPENNENQSGYNIIIEKRNEKGELIKRAIIGGKENYYPVDLKTNNKYIYVLGNTSKGDIIMVIYDKELNKIKEEIIKNNEAFSMTIDEHEINIVVKENGITKLISFNNSKLLID